MLRLKDKVKLRKVNKILFVSFILSCLLITSCKDDYFYDDQEPDWLGASIYDYLVEDGNYKYFVKLIEDVGETPVLSKTGSKTLFVSKDEAFERFFQNNDWGVDSYEKLSLNQKRLMLKYCMLDNAYIMQNLANHYDGTLVYGTALRRSTSVDVLDSVTFEKGDQLPEGELWDEFREEGIYMVKDASSWPLVYFHPKTLTNLNFTNEDFEIITGVSREDDDIHVLNKKVIEKDITCKNGYIHVLEDVLIPPTNMSEFVRHEPSVSTFANLMERYTAPYPNEVLTERYRTNFDPSFTGVIYEKDYFTESNGGGRSYYPYEGDLPSDEDEILYDKLLPYSPGWNSYRRVGGNGEIFALQEEMASMFVPTNEAMQNFLDNTGSGQRIVERYGTWSEMPDRLIYKFVGRHMRETFINALPSTFIKLRDSENYKIDINISDIVDTYIGVNGVVYVTNNVYPPVDYKSVYGPILFGEQTRIMDWAIENNEFRLYLNALDSKYSVFVPTDEFFEGYIDPVAYGTDVKAALKYSYDAEVDEVHATIYSYNDGTIGSELGEITNQGLIRNRLKDLLDAHILIGEIESGIKYYKSKGGNTIIVEGDESAGMTVRGGGDIEAGTVANITEVIEQDNGKTYFINKPIQTPLKSVYDVLSETSEFSEFFNLCAGFGPDFDSRIFATGDLDQRVNKYGINFNVDFLQNYNYTVYVPNNDSILKAIDEGVIHSWEEINATLDLKLRLEYIDELGRFLRYHFQDNSVFVGQGSKTYTGEKYQTATINQVGGNPYHGTIKNKFYKIEVNTEGESIYLITETGDTVRVINEDGLSNILVRDYVFNNDPALFEEIGSSTFNGSRIITSANVVIHQIDNVLKFE